MSVPQITGAVLRNRLRGEDGMKSSDRTKMRRHQAQAAKVRREADATTDDVARQQLVERANDDQRIAANLHKRRKGTKPRGRLI
jgi:hypothetical protein